MEDRHVRICMEVLQDAIKEKDWNKVQYTADLLNMHTMDSVLEEE